MKNWMKLTLSVALAIPLMLASIVPAQAWGGSENSDTKIMQQLDKLLTEAAQQVPLPGITNFFERRMVKLLYELRDNPEYRTYTYITSLDGKFVKVCDSIGYGINASIQFSNPTRPVDITETPRRDYAGVQLAQAPQAEPNGLFMPEGLAATYAMCLNPEDGEIAPVYLEQEITVSPFPLTVEMK